MHCCWLFGGFSFSLSLSYADHFNRRFFSHVASCSSVATFNSDFFFGLSAAFGIGVCVCVHNAHCIFCNFTTSSLVFFYWCLLSATQFALIEELNNECGWFGTERILICVGSLISCHCVRSLFGIHDAITQITCSEWMSEQAVDATNLRLKLFLIK